MAKAQTTGTPSTIWTPANITTTVRIALMPLWLLLAEASSPATSGVSWSAVLVFLGYVVISLTDKLDGYLARSRNEVTAFGQFLDPIADKLAVIVALAYLLETGVLACLMEVGFGGSWVLLVVVAREFLVSGLRMVVANAGVVVPASGLGKWKTAVTMVAICALLLIRCLPAGEPLSFLSAVATILLWVALILTVWSGIDYFRKCWAYVAGTGE